MSIHQDITIFSEMIDHFKNKVICSECQGTIYTAMDQCTLVNDHNCPGRQVVINHMRYTIQLSRDRKDPTQ